MISWTDWTDTSNPRQHSTTDTTTDGFGWFYSVSGGYDHDIDAHLYRPKDPAWCSRHGRDPELPPVEWARVKKDHDAVGILAPYRHFVFVG